MAERIIDRTEQSIVDFNDLTGEDNNSSSRFISAHEDCVLERHVYVISD